jgi:hypothetical protein
MNENNPSNIRLIQFHARDHDALNTSNSDLSYSLVPSNDSHWFSIDEYTGILSVGNVSFDYERKSQYHLILNISDHGYHPKRLETFESLTIKINNLNDHQPRFEHDIYRFYVQENTSIGTIIGRVRAFDMDFNTSIVYQWTSTFNETIFDLDRLTGQIRTRRPLDFESQSIYYLSIHALDIDMNNKNIDDDYDNDQHQHSVSTNVTIELIDINDNSPIVDTPLSVYIPSKQLQMNMSQSIVITTVIAKDRDQKQQGNLTYAILDGNSHRYFRIDSCNGTIIAQSNHLPQGYHRSRVKFSTLFTWHR